MTIRRVITTTTVMTVKATKMKITMTVKTKGAMIIPIAKGGTMASKVSSKN
jgi:hypothetical protein